MDDMLLMGPSRRKLKKAVEDMTRYIQDRLHLTVKPNWHIKKLAEEPIDMMGYVVHASGKVSIRARNFVRARRLLLRAEDSADFDLRFARRLISYKGFFKNSNSYKTRKTLKTEKIFANVQKFLSREEDKCKSTMTANRKK